MVLSKKNEIEELKLFFQTVNYIYNQTIALEQILLLIDAPDLIKFLSKSSCVNLKV